MNDPKLVTTAAEVLRSLYPATGAVNPFPSHPVVESAILEAAAQQAARRREQDEVEGPVQPGEVYGLPQVMKEWRRLLRKRK